jgi:hypothetical protein
MSRSEVAMQRSAWSGREGLDWDEDGGEEKRRARVEMRPEEMVLGEVAPDLERERLRGGCGDGGGFVVRRVLVRAEILAASRASWTSFSVFSWPQRQAAPWTWMLGRELLDVSSSRHSTLRRRFGRAVAFRVQDSLLEDSS